MTTDVYGLRVRNLKHLIAEKYEGNRAAFCRATGKHPNLINLVLTDNDEYKRRIGEKLARSIEESLNLPTEWLDLPQSGSPDAVTVIPLNRAGELLDRALPVESLHLTEKLARSQFESVADLSKIRGVYAYGDSMAPTLNNGDIVFIDAGIDELKLDAIYAVARGPEIFIKRFQRQLKGGYRVLSDNVAYPPIDMSEAEAKRLNVLGRVVGAYAFRRL